MVLLALAGLAGAGCGSSGEPVDECTPTAEMCNGVDDDCDGWTDEDLDTDVDGDGHFTSGSCRQPADDCNDDDAHMYPGHPEGPSYCDGKDNDCDDQVDEDCECQPSSQQACSSDEGECVAGTQICGANGTWGACSGVLPAAELCDGLDNDCDGQTDNVSDVQPCELTAGVCQGVTRPSGCEACDYGAQYEETETSCDGLDNDCDGQTDEELAGDAQEPNDSCGSPFGLSDYNENDNDRLVEGSLYKFNPQGAALDEDWYRIQLNEADHFIECLADGPDQCFEFILRLELPLSESQDRWELCLLDGVSGSCASYGDPNYTFCTEPGEWDPATHSYRMVIGWNGLCGAEDGGRFFLLVHPQAGQTVTACVDYKLWLQWNYVGTFACF
jgi:hypothetical protein